MSQTRTAERKVFKLKSVRQEWDEVDADKITKIVFLVAAVIYFSVLGLFLYNRKLLPPEIPVFFSKPWGQERLGGVDVLWIPVLIGLVFLVTNAALSLKVLAKDKFMQRTIAWTNIITTALMAVSIFKIITLFI